MSSCDIRKKNRFENWEIFDFSFAVAIQLMHLLHFETKLSNQKTYLMTCQCVDWNNTHADTNFILLFFMFLFFSYASPPPSVFYFSEWLNGKTRSNTSSFKVLDCDKCNQKIKEKCIKSRIFFFWIRSYCNASQGKSLGKCAHRLSGKSINTRNAMSKAWMEKFIYIIYKFQWNALVKPSLCWTTFTLIKSDSTL